MDINYYKQYEPIFGSWHITRLIGEGSFGKVFEMERQDFGVTYRAALKAITVPASESEVRSVMSEGMDEGSVRTYFGSFVQELVQEFALMSKLKGNSNVVSYENHQVMEHRDGIGWDILIQMELLTPLDDYIRQKKSISRQEIMKLGIDLCKALELCQKHNIIHRDIKPENVFISENGDFKLGDFGVARTVEKTTGGLSKKGSYPYMAPEVYNGKPYGTTVDTYSLGLILYRLLNGNRLPFLPAAPAPITYADRENALDKRFNGTPLPMPGHADGRLGEIVLKACAFDSKDRYSSPVQMRQELEAILYNKEEGTYIYPDGDEVPQNSIHSVKTEDRPPVRQEEGTVSDFGKTVSDFGGMEEQALKIRRLNLLPVRLSALAAGDSVRQSQTIPELIEQALPLFENRAAGVSCILRPEGKQEALLRKKLVLKATGRSDDFLRQTILGAVRLNDSFSPLSNILFLETGLITGLKFELWTEDRASRIALHPMTYLPYSDIQMVEYAGPKWEYTWPKKSRPGYFQIDVDGGRYRQYGQTWYDMTRMRKLLCALRDLSTGFPH